MEFMSEHVLPGDLAIAAVTPLDEDAPKGEPVISIAPRKLVAPVLGRLVSSLAVRADFSIDRLADAQLITDALGSRATGARDRITVAFEERHRRLDLRVRAVEPGNLPRLLDQSSGLAGLGAMRGSLADQVETDNDVLRLALIDDRVLTH